MKNSILLLTFFAIASLCNCAFAQNKKEQIIILSGKIDSLNVIVGKEREDYQIASSKFQNEITNLSKDLLESKGQTDSVIFLLEKERVFSKEKYNELLQESLIQENQLKELSVLRDELLKERDLLNLELKMKNDLTVKIDTLQLSEIEKVETCEVLHFKTNNEMYDSKEISFYFGSATEYPEINNINFFIEEEESGFFIGNESLVGKFFVVTYKVNNPYLFFDCEPLGDSERRQGEGRPASIGFQLLSVKKL